MNIELLPVLLGILVGLIGGAVIYDAVGDPESGPMRDRRRRMRAGIDRTGECLVGIGTFLLGVALVGRDSWRFETLTVLLGLALVMWGTVRNRAYLQEMLFFRGATRRSDKDTERTFDKEKHLHTR